MSRADAAKIEVVPRIADIPAGAWDACANPDPATFNPFIAHAFLHALEDAGTVGGRTGWAPRHLALRLADGEIAGCAPCYLKAHSQGEYVFDHSWAEAFMRAGGRYYPKLQIAVPFTPVPGRRLLVGSGPASETHERMLAAGAAEIAERNGISGLHVTFLSEGEWRRLGACGFLQRTDQQFHWSNAGYATFDDYLASLASRKRKAMRKEREQAVAAGLDIVWLRGREITEGDWDAFFAFYTETGSRKWGRPYLNRKFFSLLGAGGVGEHCLLMLAKRAGRPIAGALHLIGGDCLFGRYWGAVEHHPFLHFELCYYQAIDYAIQHRMARVEAGAQGEHKLARGYLPTKTYSAHHIVDPALRRAIGDYLARERKYVDAATEELAEYAPFRKAPPHQV
ncbi:MAG: GNAT family N-acetyltransferase [Hyphomonadaceae bacterium]|jgi:predicted N-acyltransferase|nr:GNAT family N-acetyltransferase [Hyphomonadaceae bacterium]